MIKANEQQDFDLITFRLQCQPFSLSFYSSFLPAEELLILGSSGNTLFSASTPP